MMEETKKRGRKRKSDTADTIKLTDVIDNGAEPVTVTETTTIVVLNDSQTSDENVYAVTDSTTPEELIVEDNAAPVEVTPIESEKIDDTTAPEKVEKPDKFEKKSTFATGAIMQVPYAKLYASSVAVDPFYVIRGQIVVVDGAEYDGRIKVMCLYGKNAVGWVNTSDIIV